MGDLAYHKGFYGGGFDGDAVGAQDEAGEALTISDPYETWQVIELIHESYVEQLIILTCQFQLNHLSSMRAFYIKGYHNDTNSVIFVSFQRMFHLLADDTGASAVWAAQRVPDDHITAVANQFVIGQIHLDDTANFMASGKSKKNDVITPGLPV